MTEEQNAGKILLFCKEPSPEQIMKCLRDAFDVPGSVHDADLKLHNGDLDVTIRIYCESAGGEEQELVRGWSDRSRGHFSRVETAAVDVKTNLLYQLEGTESIVSVDYTFEGEESEFLTEEEESAKRNMEQTLFGVLSTLRAVMAFRGEKRGFYCLDASGMEKLILDGNGNSEMERFLPYKSVGYVPGNDIEAEQLNRREGNRREFEAHGVYVPVFYPLLETEAEADCRTPYEIADRLPQGFCAQYVSSFPLWGSRPEMRIFSLWRGSVPFGLPFLLRASIPQKNRSLSHPPRCESIKVGESANSVRQLCGFQKPDVVVQVGGLGIPVSGSRVRKRMGTITKNQFVYLPFCFCIFIIGHTS